MCITKTYWDQYSPHVLLYIDRDPSEIVRARIPKRGLIKILIVNIKKENEERTVFRSHHERPQSKI